MAEPDDLGRSCQSLTIRHHVTNQTDSQNAGALPLTWDSGGCHAVMIPELGDTFSMRPGMSCWTRSRSPSTGSAPLPALGCCR
jgi:hypothetical protein